MASVTPRRLRSGEVVWRVQFRIDGQMRQETFGDAEAAIEFGVLVDRVGGKAARKTRDLRSQANVSPVTLAQWSAEYLTKSNGMAGGTSPRTLRDYADMAERSFLPRLGEIPVGELTPNDVGRWIAWQESQVTQRTGQPIASKTIRNYQGLLSTILSAAVKNGHLLSNPARGASISYSVPREPVFLSPREFGVLLRFIPPYYRPLTNFLAMTGTRWSEATAVEWGDFSFDASPVTLRISKSWNKGDDGIMRIGSPKTKKSRRTMSLDTETIAALGPPGPDEDRIFVGKLGADRIWYGRFRESIFEKAVAAARDKTRCAELGLLPISKKPTIHDLRHTHASWLIARNVPLPVIQDRLGHESIKTTIDIYGHLSPESLGATALVMEGIEADVLAASGIASAGAQEINS